MKQFIVLAALLCIMLFLPIAYASTRKHPTGIHARTYSAVRHSSASRPYYGGGRHTTSHGGQYPGATNAHHRNGHYQNWWSGNRYGVHKPY